MVQEIVGSGSTESMSCNGLVKSNILTYLVEYSKYLCTADLWTFHRRTLTRQLPQSFELFMLAIGIYLILITAILTRFSSTIENGGDRTQFMYDLGQALPISIIVFTVTAITARTFFRGLI